MPRPSAQSAYTATTRPGRIDPAVLADPVVAAAVASTASSDHPSAPTTAVPPAPQTRPAPPTPVPGPGLRRGQDGTWQVSGPSAADALARARDLFGDDVTVLSGRAANRGLLGRKAQVTVTVQPALAAAPASATDPEAVPGPAPAGGGALPSDFQSTLRAALGAVSAVVDAATPATSASQAAHPLRDQLAALDVPAEVLAALPAAEPGDRHAALTAAIATLAPAPATLRAGLAVTSGSGPAGAAAILRAAQVGVLPGQIVLDGIVAPATPANLAAALLAEPPA